MIVLSWEQVAIYYSLELTLTLLILLACAGTVCKEDLIWITELLDSYKEGEIKGHNLRVLSSEIVAILWLLGKKHNETISPLWPW